MISECVPFYAGDAERIYTSIAAIEDTVVNHEDEMPDKLTTTLAKIAYEVGRDMDVEIYLEEE